MNAVTILSGGLDSTTLAYLLAERKYEQHFLSFHYGQRHYKELGYAYETAKRLHSPHDVVDLSSVAKLLKGSALTDAIDVPDGSYTDKIMQITIVPNRNAMMLAIAYAVAVAEKADIVAYGAHAGDHDIYPDCRPMFVERFDAMEQVATESGIHMYTPFVYLTKADIVSEGQRLGVDFTQTWTCYKGGEKHCGTCSACDERKWAFAAAGIADPTEYMVTNVHP